MIKYMLRRSFDIGSAKWKDLRNTHMIVITCCWSASFEDECGDADVCDSDDDDNADADDDDDDEEEEEED